jgi:hypothetical protein
MLYIVNINKFIYDLDDLSVAILVYLTFKTPLIKKTMK